MMLKILFLVLGLAFDLIPFGGDDAAVGVKHTRSLDSTYAAVPQLNITTWTTDCEIKGTDDNTVTLHLEYDSTSYCLLDYAIDETDTALIIIEGLDESYHKCPEYKPDAAQFTGYSSLIITAPSDVRIVFTSMTGKLVVRGIRGDITASSNTGNISVDGRPGILTLESAAGTIDVCLHQTPRHDMSLSSGSGDVRLNCDGCTLVGQIEFMARADQGRIISPYQFTFEEEVMMEPPSDKVAIEIDNSMDDEATTITIDSGVVMKMSEAQYADHFRYLRKVATRGYDSPLISLMTGIGTVELRI